MTEINPVNFSGTKIQGQGTDKMAKAKYKIEEQVKNLVSKLHVRAEREVPEYGDFAVVYEEFKNPDKNLSASNFMLKIYKPKNVKDEKLRCVEAAAYALPAPYKAEMPLLLGRKEDILKLLQDEEFAVNLQKTFVKLSQSLESV